MQLDFVLTFTGTVQVMDGFTVMADDLQHERSRLPISMSMPAIKSKEDEEYQCLLAAIKEAASIASPHHKKATYGQNVHLTALIQPVVMQNQPMVTQAIFLPPPPLSTPSQSADSYPMPSPIRAAGSMPPWSHLLHMSLHYPQITGHSLPSSRSSTSNKGKLIVSVDFGVSLALFNDHHMLKHL
jgi:hypothetical protein